MNIVDTIEGKDGYKIRICYDEDSEDPRTFFTNFGTFVLSHRKYSVANETDFKFQDYNGWEALQKAVVKEHGPCVILPVFMYDHSGVALSTVREGCFADQWDSGVLGFIFVSHKRIRDEFALKHVSKKALAKSREILVSEVELYGYYLNGEVYCYDILDEAGNETGTSGMGFFGYDHDKNGLKEAALESIDEVIASASIKEPVDAEQMVLVL